MSETMPVRMRVVGVGPGGSTVFAERLGDEIRFGALLKAGRLAGTRLLVHTPVLTPLEGARWVRDRIDGFRTHPGARESTLHALQRKALAAHGLAFVTALRRALPAPARMELDMMFSSDSHHQAIPLDQVRTSPVVTLSRPGTATGAAVAVLVDSTGRLWRLARAGTVFSQLLGADVPAESR